MFISRDQLEDCSSRYSFLKKKNIDQELDQYGDKAYLADVAPETIDNNLLGNSENLIKRRQLLDELGTEPADFAFERAIGKNDSVYSNFVDLLRNATQKVGRIAVRVGNQNVGFATGFMVSDNLLLTNWHVFKTMEDAVDSEVQFGYELDGFGRPKTPVTFRLRPDQFYFSRQELDYCFLAVEPLDITGKIRIQAIGYIAFDQSQGKLGEERHEALNIIHHPDGDYKQLSIRENLFMRITPTTIWYESDTAPGSSGSPVFNDQWQLIALHHMGVAKKNKAGQYVDKNGDVIDSINGMIDASKVVWIANEGIRASVILKDVRTYFPEEPLIAALVEPQNNVWESPDIRKDPGNLHHESGDENDIHIVVPSALLEKNGSYTIRIQHEGKAKSESGTVSANLTVPSATEIGINPVNDIRRLELEMDFSACKGYSASFLPVSVPFPKPLKALAKFVAKVPGTTNNILKYHAYSVLFHSVRMMPAVSAINVDGNPKKRLDNSKRDDTWLRDKRLGMDIQLDDEFYAGSNFDKGHLSRREDANWGTTADIAKRNADLTCMYTNACPQVPALNRSNRNGLWGNLENIVLEKGAIKEQGATGKITVFNGPIFKDSDPVFRGIQIPVEFYKIIVWPTSSKEIRATAFKLSQGHLLDDVNLEDLDIDQNVQFKQYQCSIASIIAATQLDFKALLPFDTFKATAKPMELKSEAAVVGMLEKA